ncbi:hypothetical protein DFS34DRAFT_140099 [Phlyctochytrium arcticum]|nr:hypothetical protein DFS34DRAFT_140099 [Phlyctochytrium arcticum]
MGALTNPNGQTYSPTWALEAKALLAAMSAYWIITIVAFTYRRRYWMAAGRQVQWTLLQAAGAWVSIAMHCIEIIQWYDHICWLQLWFNGISILIWCCAVGAQAVRLLFQYKVNKAKLFGAGKMANQSFNSRIVQHHPTPWEEEEKNPEPPSSHPSARTLLMQRLTRALSLSSWRSSATGLPTSTASSGGGDVKDSLTKGLQQDWYWTNRGRGTDRVLWKWVIGIVIVYVIHLFIIEVSILSPLHWGSID